MNLNDCTIFTKDDRKKMTCYDHPFDKFNKIAHELIKTNPTISLKLWKWMLIHHHYDLIVTICGSTKHEQNMVLESFWESRKFSLEMTFSDWQKYYEGLLLKYSSFSSKYNYTRFEIAAFEAIYIDGCDDCSSWIDTMINCYSKEVVEALGNNPYEVFAELEDIWETMDYEDPLTGICLTYQNWAEYFSGKFAHTIYDELIKAKQTNNDKNIDTSNKESKKP